MVVSREPEETKRFRGELAAQKRAEGQLALLEAQKVADAEKRMADQAHALELARIKEESAARIEAMRLAQKAADEARKKLDQQKNEEKKSQLAAVRQQAKDQKVEQQKSAKETSDVERKAKKSVIDLEKAQRAASRKVDQEAKAKQYKDEKNKEKIRQDQVNMGLLAQRDLLKGVAESLPEGVGRGLLSAINTVKTLRGMGGGAMGLGGFAAGAMGIAGIGSAVVGTIFQAAAAQKQLTIDGLQYQRQWGGTLEDAKKFARESKRTGQYLGEGGEEFTQQLIGWSKINEDSLGSARQYVEMMQNAAEPENLGLENAMKMHQIFASMREQITKNPVGHSTVTRAQIREAFVGTGFQTMKVAAGASQQAKDLSNGGKLDAYDVAMKMTGLDTKGGQITQKDLDLLQSTLLSITKNVDTPIEAKTEDPVAKMQREFEELVSGLMPKINEMAGGVLKLVEYFTQKPEETKTTTSEGGKATLADYVVAQLMPKGSQMEFGGYHVRREQLLQNYEQGRGVLHGSEDLAGATDRYQSARSDSFRRIENHNNWGGITIHVNSTDKDIPEAVKSGAQQGLEAGTANLSAAQGGK